jgi:hypothetical protein
VEPSLLSRIFSFKFWSVYWAIFAGLGGAWLVASCGSLPIAELKPVQPANPCQAIDWWEVGRTDGASGAAPTKIIEYEKRCEPYHVKVEDDLYQNGYDEGLVDFCTPTQGIEVGRTGQPYLKVCPANLEAAFLKGMDRGVRIRKLEAENMEIERRIQEANAKQSAIANAELLDQLRKKRAKNETEIGTLGALPQDF